MTRYLPKEEPTSNNYSQSKTLTESLLKYYKFLNAEIMNEVFSWFNNFTSLGGYTQYVASKNPTSKIFWAILTFLGLFITIYSIERNFDDMMAFHVTTSVSVSDNSSLKFPTVTLCNTNRVDCIQLFKKIEICKEVIQQIFTVAWYTTAKHKR